MTRIEALKELLAKVETGRWDCNFPDKGAAGLGSAKRVHNCIRAYHGDLNAAKALHETILPDWVVGNMGQGVCDEPKSHWTVWLVRSDYLESTMQAEGKSDDPARAWLIAIIKALIAQETNQ